MGVERPAALEDRSRDAACLEGVIEAVFHRNAGTRIETEQ